MKNNQQQLPQQTQNHTDIKFPYARLVFIVISFLLGILDMTLLYPAVRTIFGMQNIMAMGFALLFATLANFMAFMWGYDEVKGKPKDAKLSFATWAAIGVFYAILRVLRIINSFNTVENYNMVGDILQIFVLAVLFISTGTLIYASAKEIADPVTSNARKLEKEFTSMREEVVNQSAEIRQTIRILQDYDLNYKSLERQAKKIKGSIYRTEDGTMAEIVARVLARNKNMLPGPAHEVKDEVLSERRKMYESREN